MRHITQPRGGGTAYQFKMRTPLAMKGMNDPATGKVFGTYIKRSLGATRHLPTAKKMRDIRLAEIRAMEADAIRGAELGDRFSLDRASAWAEALQVQRAKGGPDEHEPDVLDLIEAEANRAPSAKRKTFEKVALSNTLSITDAVYRYLHDRREGNGHDYAPLRKTTQNDLWVEQWPEHHPESVFAIINAWVDPDRPGGPLVDGRKAGAVRYIVEYMGNDPNVLVDTVIEWYRKGQKAHKHHSCEPSSREGENLNNFDASMPNRIVIPQPRK